MIKTLRKPLLLIVVILLTVVIAVIAIGSNGTPALTDGHTHDSATFTELTQEMINAVIAGTYGTAGVIPEGSYYLVENVTVGDALTVTNGVVKICLNGKTMDFGTNDITVDVSGELNVYDCSTGETGVVRSTNSSSAILNNGTLTFNGGTITGNDRGIYNNAKFTMLSGSITNNWWAVNSSESSGVDNIITLTGGTIEDN